MSVRVQISQRAKRDIREIATWIKSRSAKGALSWLAALEKNLGRLPKDAESSVAAVVLRD